MAPAPSFDHQRSSGNLSFTLRLGCPDGLIVLAAPFDVQVEERSVVQPDLRDGRYQVAALVAGDEEWTASAPSELTLVPSALLA